MPDHNFTHSAFVDHLKDHKLMGSICQSCGMKYLPPRPLCTACHETKMEWVEMERVGKLKAYTVIHIAPTAMLDEGYGRDNPYCTGIVEFPEGLSMSGQILGVDARNPESIVVGTPVTVEFVERGEGEEQQTFLAFRVKEEAD